MTTAYLFLLATQDGRVSHLEIMSDPNYSGPTDPGAPVAAVVLHSEGTDFGDAASRLLRAIEHVPNLRRLWQSFGRMPW